MKPQRARRNSWEKAECRNTFLIRYSVLSKVKKTKEESRRLEKAGHRGGGGSQMFFQPEFKLFSVGSVVNV
jgi:hypothetical protein